MTDLTGNDRLRCPATMDSYHEFQAFVQEKALELGLAPEKKVKLELVMEELTVNVIHYAYPDSHGDLEVHCLLEEDSVNQRFCVQLRDWGRPFNPLDGEPPDTELPLEDRTVGGLGILLAEEIADSIHYLRDEGSNVLTFCFDLA